MAGLPAPRRTGSVLSEPPRRHLFARPSRSSLGALRLAVFSAQLPIDASALVLWTAGASSLTIRAQGQRRSSEDPRPTPTQALVRTSARPWMPRPGSVAFPALYRAPFGRSDTPGCPGARPESRRRGRRSERRLGKQPAARGFPTLPSRQAYGQVFCRSQSSNSGSSSFPSPTPSLPCWRTGSFPEQGCQTASLRTRSSQEQGLFLISRPDRIRAISAAPGGA